MGYCKTFQTDCLYTDRDNKDKCSLDICKFNIEIVYKPNGKFETKPIEIKNKE